MPWTGSEKGLHIDEARLHSVATTALELSVEELRHMLKCDECLNLFSNLRDQFHPTKAKAFEQNG